MTKALEQMLSSSRWRGVRQLVVGTAGWVPLFAATYYSAFLLRFAGELSWRIRDVYLSTVLWVVLVKLAAFFWFRLHQGWTRYLCFHDLVVLSQAVTCGALGVTLVDAMCVARVTIPRSVIVIDWGATLLVVGGLRALPRLIRSDAWQFFAASGPTAFIVGASDAGATLLRAIRTHSSVNYRVIAFIDDRPALQQCRIEGIPVIGTCRDLPRLTQRHRVEEVLITSGELPGKQVRSLVEMGHKHAFRVTVLPSYEHLLSGRVAVHPRSVAIEDLLSRPSVKIDLNGVREWLAGRTVMVTGSAGSIGSEICRQLLTLRPQRLVLMDRAETGQFYLERELNRLAENCGLRTADCGLSNGNPQSEIRNPQSSIQIDTRLADLTDRCRLETVFRETRPEIIFHAAAYKHVPLMELHCGEAVKNIVLATRNLVDLADEHGAQALVMISTDKAVNPSSVMGSCKRLAEQYVQARAAMSQCRFVTVRFGNVLDSSGSVVPIFREQIARGGPVTVTHPDITRYFMLIPEAAQLVIQAGAMGQGGEIFVLDMGEPVRILDLAHDMIRLSGLRVGDDIEVQFCGLRPGEKLYEELYDVGQVHHRTAHPKIMVAASAGRNLLEVIRDIGRLEPLVDGPNDEVRAALQQIIPLPDTPAEAQRRAAA
jgi:FlaA1/EpsC-like NDP-sugar epimerase